MPNLYSMRGWIEYVEDGINIKGDILKEYSNSGEEKSRFYVRGWQFNNYDFNNLSYIFYGLQTKREGVEIFLRVIRNLAHAYTGIKGEFSIADEYEDEELMISINEGKIRFRNSPSNNLQAFLPALE